jgi:hypothetical protein
MRNEKKVKIQITSSGMLNCFGYQGLRTPAHAELFEHQLAVLEQMGVTFNILREVQKTESAKKETKQSENK